MLIVIEGLDLEELHDKSEINETGDHHVAQSKAYKVLSLAIERHLYIFCRAGFAAALFDLLQVQWLSPSTLPPKKSSHTQKKY